MKWRQKKQKQKTTNHYFDYSLLFIVIFLVFFGTVMMYSTSTYIGRVKFDDAEYFLIKQLIAVGVGFVAMLFVANVDYHVWRYFWFWAYLLAMGLCILVLVITDGANGSKRWLRIGPFSFQPSESAKLAVIVFFAVIISSTPKMLGKIKTIGKIMLMAVPLVLVVAKENLSTAVIILGIIVSMLFIASPNFIKFIVPAMVVFLSIVAFALLAGYRKERIEIWLNPFEHEKGFQTVQGLYAIGSGGLFGKGLGSSMQKLGFVPEPQNDMVFSIICEELGLFGAICVILLFVLLLWRFLIIANNAPDLYGALLVTGVFAHIAIQVVLNIAVVTNIVPNTGISLPFISYGGTSVVFLMIEIGLALGVSKRIQFE